MVPDTPDSPSGETIIPEERTVATSRPHHILRWLGCIDLLVFVALIAFAAPPRWEAARGDFWLDEADYATAAIRGFQANRWDAPEPSGPDKIIRLRHFHPPLISHVMGWALRSGRDDRHLRLPAVIAGSVTVGLVYLCGLYLFAPRGDPDRWWLRTGPRLVALACAVIIIPTPAHIRASSHALPWAFITLWLVAIALTMAGYARTRHVAWLAGLGVSLGLLFATSEYVAVAAAAVGLALPLLIWADVRDPQRCKVVAVGVGVGLASLVIVAYVLWPAGLFGGLPKMLRHYMEMAHDSWPVIIDGETYDRAPKWAYAYWYRRDYPAYAWWYALSAAGVLVLAVRRRLNVGTISVAILSAAVLLAAHKSHIIGPEYLVHALPLMTLLGGLLFAAFIDLSFSATALLALGGALIVCRTPITSLPLAGMYDRDRISRWPTAAVFLKGRWTPDSRMLAPAYGGVGRWYLIYGAGTKVEEWRVQALPASGARDKLIRDITARTYQFVVVGSTFSDWADVDLRIRKIITKWPVVWRSDEHGTGSSRLVIYELPPSRAGGGGKLKERS